MVQDESKLAELLEEQIRATNRVNHAVRAIVIPSTIVLIFLLISVPFIVIGFWAGEPVVFFLPGIILLIGGVLAIVSQIRESALSEMPLPTAPSSSEDLNQKHPTSSLADDPNLNRCSFCGTQFPKDRMACPECGMR